ncbi:MAG: BolA family transcriptional regulator [Alphaproteobacteria bacterium]|nr:MAG: BolA family transcriptional regulator [Alphaproteobacteria bacterium]
MKVADTIRRKLTEALSPVALHIVDDSDKHRGHAGYREGGESHFTVTIVSTAFEGDNRVARQRKVYTILAEELAGPVHALSVFALTPAEARSQEKRQQ